jgi:hypothetical protein
MLPGVLYVFGCIVVVVVIGLLLRSIVSKEEDK